MGPALTCKIENKPLLERDPERPETFQDSTQGMGFQGRVKRIFFELKDFLANLSFQFRVITDPLPVDLLKPFIADQFNYSDPPEDPLPSRAG